MKAAVVQGFGRPPVYADFESPAPGAGEKHVHVSAAALTHLAKGRASGAHYSSGAQFPFIAGVDGVGRLEDGARVYFLMPRFPYGAFAEEAAVPARQCLALPDGLDDATAAAIANPGMSSWAALVERARLARGETVLINGATGVAGRLAVQIAKHLGAGKVIATGRKPQTLQTLSALGADVTISFDEDPATTQAHFERHFGDGINVVLDYLWGGSAERLLLAAARCAPEAAPIRFVQIGSVSGTEITLPGAVLRSKAIELMGSGLGSVGGRELVASIAAVLQAAAAGALKIDVETAPLSEVEQRWDQTDSARRLVFTLGD